jgi:hypothetical protein
MAIPISELMRELCEMGIIQSRKTQGKTLEEILADLPGIGNSVNYELPPTSIIEDQK